MPENIEKTFFSTTVKADRDGRWVLSASSPDRVGDTIAPAAYQSALKRIKGKLIALFNHDSGKIAGFWENLKVEGHRLTGDLKLANTNLGKMLRQLLEDEVPISSSIGFRGLDAEPNDHGGLHFKDIEILETSLVATPAHPAAIQIAKHYDIDLGTTKARERADAVAPLDDDNAAPAHAPVTERLKEKTVMNITEKLAQYAKQIADAAEEQNRIKAAALEEDRDLTEDEMEKIDTLKAAAEHAEKQQKYWTEEERQQAARAKPAEDVARKSVPAIVHNYRKDENPARLFAKTAVCNIHSRFRHMPVDAVAKELYPNDDRVEAFATDLLLKTAATAARTDQTGWVQELMETASKELVESLKPVSVYARLASMGRAAMFNGARDHTFLARTPVALAEAQHAWVGEGGVIPVIQGTYTSRSIERNKIAGIVVATREALRYAAIDLEADLEAYLREDLAQKIDQALLSNGAAVQHVSSAGLLNAAANGATTAAGSNLGTTTQADIDADISGLRSVFTAANYNGAVALLMNPAQVDKLYTVVNASGAYIYRDAANNMVLNGMSIIASTNVPAKTVIAVGASDFVTTYDPAEIEVDDSPTVTMANADATAPTQAMDASGDLGTAGEVPPKLGIHVTGFPPGSGTANPTASAALAVSMFQTWQVAIRQVLPIGWAMRRSGLVVSRTAVHW